MQPVIGITITTRKGFTEYYVNAVEKVGGIPIVLPILEDTSQIQPILKELHGVIFTGGTDINPFYYNEEPRYGLGEVKPYRDEHEFKLLELCLEKFEGPVMGICRGMQLINVLHGGSMYQCLEQDRSDGIMHALIERYPLEYPSHLVYLKENSWLFKICAQQTLYVNSLHHQGVKELGKSLKVSARAGDGLIEGIEREGERLVFGLQWHPEMMMEKSFEARKIFTDFVQECKYFQKNETKL